MLAPLRTLPVRSSCARSLAATTSRSFSASAARRAEDDDAYVENVRSVKADKQQLFRAFQTWLKKDGAQYKTAHRPQNYLGGGPTPFPLNPSFQPPVPVSDAKRTRIYNEFMSNPRVNNVRNLATRHGLSLARVDAILRLKGLEDHWKKGKELQTGFQVGMEFALGVEEEPLVSTAPKGISDTAAADLQSEEEGNSTARNRYQRLFWEPMVEGQDSVIVRVLENAQAKPVKPQTPTPKKRQTPPAVVTREGRPDIHFVDVGDEFIDPKEMLARKKAASHRAVIRARRAAKRAQVIASTKAAA